MVDPDNVTDFNRNRMDLEEFLIFSVCVAGKTAKIIAPAVDKFLKQIEEETPTRFLSATHFDYIREYKENFPVTAEATIAGMLKRCGIGCFNAKAKSILAICEIDDLKNISVENLESYPGIGPKTARFFIMHSRENCNVAALDTHILRFLKDLGFDTPNSTPTGKAYRKWELVWLKVCEHMGLDSTTVDLAIWRLYSSGLKNIKKDDSLPLTKNKCLV